MNAKRLEQIKARAANATAGPWILYHHKSCEDGPSQNRIDTEDGVTVVSDSGFSYDRLRRKKHDANARFIANARQDIPDLLTEIERLTTSITALEADNERLREALKPFVLEGFDLKNVELRVDLGTFKDIRAARRALEAKP